MPPVMKRMTVNEEDVLNQESDDAMMFSPPTMQSPKTKKRQPNQLTNLLKHVKSRVSLSTVDMRSNTFEVSRVQTDLEQSPPSMGKRTFEQAFISAEQGNRSKQYFQVENMEVENARLCETQLQKRMHVDQDAPIESTFNINYTNWRTTNSNVPKQVEVLDTHSVGFVDILVDHANGQFTLPESAFDFKYLGPSSSLQVNQISNAQNEAEQLMGQMYMLTENLQPNESVKTVYDEHLHNEVDILMQTLTNQDPLATNPEDADDGSGRVSIANNQEDEVDIIESDSNSN